MENTNTNATETATIKIGDWYYMMLGYGGSESRMVCIIEKTGEKTSPCYSLLGNANGSMHYQGPVDMFYAMDEKGCTMTVSDHNLAATGHIGIGTLQGPKEHAATVSEEDAERLLRCGYSRESILANFGAAAFGMWAEDGGAINDDRASHPMTETQIAMLTALHAKAEEEQREKDRKDAEAFTAARTDCLRKYAFLPCHRKEGEYMSKGDKSRNVRAMLKHEFPDVKFSVTTRGGSDSIRIVWENGPTAKAVEKVANMFEDGRFDAYTDYHYSESSPFSSAFGGFDYVFVERNVTEDVREKVCGFISERLDLSARSEYERRAILARETHKALASADLTGNREIVGVGFCETGYVVLFAEEKKPTPPPTDGGDGDSVKVTENTEKNGIEIRFPSMPSASVRDFMKSRNWRWSKFSRCWWHTANAEARETAAEVVAMWNAENRNEAA